MLLVAVGAAAQMFEPVSFAVSQKRVADDVVEVTFRGTIDDGWHVYSTNLPGGGPTAATFNVDEAEGVVPDGALRAVGKEENVFDKIFNMQVRYFSGTVSFVQRLRITAPTYSFKGYLEYGACDDKSCLPPTAVDVVVKGNDGPAAVAKPVESAKAEETKAEEPSELVADSATVGDTLAVANAGADDDYAARIWQPVADKLGGFGSSEGKSWWVVFLLGFGGGLIALLTPCVWPIIPMTVSFFLKRGGSRRKGVRDAVVYGLAIIIIYVSLGLLVTLWRGPSALNELSTNAVFNLLFFAMLVVFGASFLGGFEIELPSRWTQAVNSKADSTSGFVSIFLMAFTLSLVSFSCTGPIIGFLLVEVATTGGFIAPALGMLGFSMGLALPFSLFALFPSLLQSVPKSGGWLNVVKVSLGFLEIAFALKFLSVADLAYGWGILDREVFLVLWIVLFALLGLYLLGKLRFPHDDKDAGHTSVPRFFGGVAALAFALYMVPGLWGAPLRAISAFAPPMNTQDFNLIHTRVEPRFKDYEAGMAYARSVGKPVMIDFTGHGCVNCRKMEASVWHDEGVARLLNDDYVLISLYVDDKTRLPKPIEVQTESGTRTLRTVGDKWSYLQSSKFGYNAQPFYVLLDNEGLPLTKPYAYDESISRYTDFLEQGLGVYKSGR